MPERDYTSMVADKLKPMVERVKLNVKQKVYLGPGVTRLNPTEALARLKLMTPEERKALVREMGLDEFATQVDRLLEGKSARTK